MKRFTLPLIPITLTLPVWAGDKAAGEAKTQACVGCHGAQGKSLVPTFP